MKILGGFFLFLIFLHIFFVAREVFFSIKFNPNAEIYYENRKYLIEREISEGTRDGWDYQVRRFTEDGFALKKDSVAAEEGTSLDIHSCREIFQEGEYLVVLDYDYCSGWPLFDMIFPQLFYAGEIKRFKLI